MKKYFLIISLSATILLAGGCSKKLKNFQSDYFSTRPTPLETVGQNIPGTVTAQIPAKFMVKNAKVIAPPVIAWVNSGIEG